mgnify:CR=1 FL=1
MANVNTKRIEESATTALKTALLRCPILESYIDSNDKTPSWDGTVFVYKSEKTKKDNLTGRVPIQIKGTEKVIVSDDATFSCSVADLKNYYHDGGCVFFLISVDLSSGSSKIFYKTLLVVDLDKIIKSAGKQKTTTIHLTLFPTDANEISSIFMEFTDNVHKQMGFIGKDIPTLESLEKNGAEITSLTFTASGIGLTWEKLPKFLSTHDFYLYAKTKGLDVDVPIDKITKAIVSKPVDGEVRVKERCFFPTYHVVYEEGKSIIRIGTGISVDVLEEDKRITVHTNRPDTLSDYILEAEFFLDMVEKGELTLNGVTLLLNGVSLPDLQAKKKTLEYCKDVKKMLDYLGVTEELYLNDLSENDEKNLRNFTGAVLYNKKIGFPNIEQDQFYGAFKIANLAIWIWANRQLDGLYSIENFFKLHQITLFTEDDVELQKPIQTSQFVLLDKKGLVHISNMDYERVYSDISQTFPSPEYCTRVNFLILDMIAAYDEQTKHDEKLLDLAERICDWLRSIESVIDSELLLLNKFQITKRRRTLSISEIVELAKLTERKYPPAIRCGAYLLMDADEEAQKCFDEFLPIEQEEFLKYPICHFGKLTMEEDKTNG